MKAKVQSFGHMGIELLDYEGCSTLWFRNWDDAENFFNSPEYAGLSADCAHFMDTSKGIKMIAGYVLLSSISGKAS